jgi:translocation and assembly module TamA
VFVDSGEAVSDIRRSDFKTGAGVGVRWQSPVGPIKLDFAGRSATKKSMVYSFTSVWGLNYEFMEEDKPRRTDFYVLLLGTVAFLVGTTTGLHLLFNAANRWVPGLEIGKVTGGWRDLR